MLKKITANKKILPSLLLFLVFFGLFFAVKPAFAIWGIGDLGLLDLANMQLDALDFVDTTILKFFYTFVLLLVGSEIFVTISATLLQWAVGLPVYLGPDNLLVQTGWSFISGLTNMFFILVLLGIAFAYIFKMETYEMKKALAPLIIVALLINFSLLFVQIFADIGQVVWNTMTASFGNNFIKMAIDPLLNNLGAIVTILTAVPPIYIGTSLIPYANVVSAVGLAGWFLGDITGIIPGAVFLKGLSLVFINFVLGSIFFAYSALFLARIVIMWLLAVSAPLAFFAYILPSTRKYFEQWFHMLLDWSFLGIIAFFLLGLGMNLFALMGKKALLPWGADISTGRGTAPGILYNYIFLIVYMLIVLWLSKKFAPKGTEMVWGLGKLAVTGGGALAVGQVRKYGLRAKAAGLEAAAGTKQQIMDKRARGAALSWRERIASPFLRQVRPELAEAQALVLRGGIIKDQRSKLLAKTKDMDEEGVKATLRAEMEKHAGSRVRDPLKTSALMELLAEKDALKDSDFNLYEEAWKAAGPDDPKRNRVKKATLSKRLDWGTPAERRTRIETINQRDIDNLSVAAKENDTVIEEIVGTLRSDFISRLGSQTKTAGQKIQVEIDRTIGEAWRNYPPDINAISDDDKRKLLRQLGVIHYGHVSPVAQVLGWKKYGAKTDVENKMDALRQSLP